MSPIDTNPTITGGGGEEPLILDKPSGKPPSVGIVAELREGLFKDAKNTILTLIFAAILGYAGYRGYQYVFNNLKVTPDGDFVNSWVVVRSNLSAFMVGTRFEATGIGFPLLWSAIFLATFTLGFATGPEKDEERLPMSPRTKVSIIGPPIVGALVIMQYTETWTPRILMMLIPVAFAAGFYLFGQLPEAVRHRKTTILVVLGALVFLLETGFKPANVDQFGGMLLTINAAFISIILCFPIGVVAALARRSSFPLIRPLAVAYIELIRGVPLISLLFMGQFALGFFLAPGSDPLPNTIRSIFMITLFSAAYVAEIVRGGLQSVSKGQIEAGQAVGLSPITINRRIVLPQALRNSIPALVGQFIALLKDTTLLIIIGQFDLLGVSVPILARPEFKNQNYKPEVYAFVAFLFWIITFSMSRASQRLETKLGVGTR